MSYSLMLGWLLSSAVAQDTCDGKALAASLAEANPITTSRAFAKLAACDPARAKKAAPAALDKMVGDDDVTEALVAAIDLGFGEKVGGWLSRQEPDVRSRTISSLGDACADHTSVADFFVAVHARKGAEFFVERWHRGLADCPTPGVRALLTEALDSREVGRPSRDRQQFFSLLEVYARNLGADAVPTLKGYLAEYRDEAEATLLVNVFADAANVGAASGTDAAAADAVVAAITELAPKLPPKAIDRARSTFRSLGRDEEASGLARHYWPDRYLDGTYTYGFAAVQDITCKNGSKRAVMHLSTVTDDGARWPDELEPVAVSAAKGSWSLEAASKCKGEGKVTIRMTPEPLAGAEGLAAWRKDMMTDFEERFGAAKRATIDEAPLRP